MDVAHQLHQLNREIAEHANRGQYEQASRLASQAVDLARDSLGVNSAGYAVFLNNLAWVHDAMGQHRRAIPVYQEAITVQRRALGSAHPELASTLKNLALSHRSIHRNADAAPLFRQALEIDRLYYGPRHAFVVETLIHLGQTYRGLGQFAHAESSFREALEIRQELVGEQHAGFVECLENLAELHHAWGRYSEAEPLFIRILNTRRQLVGQMHPGYAAALTNLGRMYRSMGNFRSAEPLFRQALEIDRRTVGEHHPNFALSLNNLAELQHFAGNTAQCEPLFQQVLEIMRSAGREDDPHYAVILGNLASLHQTIGNFSTALPLFQEALEARRRTVGENHPDFAFVLHNLAVLHLAMGNFATAIPLFQQCLEIRRRTLGNDHPDTGATLHDVAEILSGIGDTISAEKHYREALGIKQKALGEHHPSVATTLNGLAWLCYVKKDFKSAGSLYRQAGEIVRMTLGERHPKYALSLRHLAEMKYIQGDSTTAQTYYQNAGRIVREALGENHREYADCLTGLAMLYKANGMFAAAEPMLIQALQICRQVYGEEHPGVARALESLAGVLCATGRESGALPLLKQAAAIDDVMVGQVFSVVSESQRLTFMESLQHRVAEYLSLTWQCFEASSEAVRSAFELVLRRKAIAAEAFAVQRDAVLGGRYPELKPQLDELTQLRVSIAGSYLSRSVTEKPQFHPKQLAEWIRRKDLLEVELAGRIPEMRIDKQLRRADEQAIAAHIPENSALIEFIRFDVRDFSAVPTRGERLWKPARYVAFVLAAGKPNDVRMIDLGEAVPIERLIADLRNAITIHPADRTRDMLRQRTAPAPTTDACPGLALRAAVFDKLLPALCGCRRLLIAPDGDLCRLPFEVLPTEDGRYLIDDFELSYLSAGRDVLRFGTSTEGQPSGPLVIADPDFDLIGDGDVAPSLDDSFHSHSRDLDGGQDRFHLVDRLPGTRLEGRQIADLLGARLWLADQALDRLVKQSCRSPRILHFATHGFFFEDQRHDPEQEVRDLSWSRPIASDMENPMLRSGLVLAGYNTWLRRGLLRSDAEDGVLTAEDITGIDLSNTELVVLSACHTGEGDIHVGEGVFGLRRSFVLAGARTLVMSLWTVADEQTQKLMAAFYRGLVHGQPRGEALRTAQLQIKSEHSDPYFWGSFICQGDPGKLKVDLKIR